MMMAVWTREELEEQHPMGATTIQIDQETRLMTEQEWNEHLDSMVGDEKWESPFPDPPGGE
jgi:hypothetical protein